MTPDSRTIAEWGNRVAAEYRSAALAAQVLHLGIQIGLPEELLATALRVVRDELDHARISHEVRAALGGAEAPVPFDPRALALPLAPEGPLASIVDCLVPSFCLGETFAVPLFSAMRAHTTHPEARAALDRILQDEAVHRAFGWEALDALIEIDPDGVRARVEAALPRWLVGFRKAYGEVGGGVPLSEEERAAGLLPAEGYRRIWAETVHNELAPRFARRGIPLPPEAANA